MRTSRKVLDLMEEAGLSQADLARLLGRHRSTVHGKLHGQRRVVIGEALQVAAILSARLERQLTVEELFGPEAA